MNFLDIFGIKKAILQAFEDVMVKFSFWISRMIYPLIADFYEVFDILARHRFFTDETIKKISNNIYVLISIIMLFAFSIKLINAIVNPDALTDKKKGFTGLFIRAIVGVLLIVLIPWAFQFAYELQDKVLDRSLIQKIVLNDQTPVASSGGDVIAGATLSAFLTARSGYQEFIETLEALPELSETIKKAVETNELDDQDVATLYELNVDNSNACPTGFTFGDMKNIKEYISNGYDESLLTDDNKKLINELELSGGEDEFLADCVVYIYHVYTQLPDDGYDEFALNLIDTACIDKYNQMISDISKIDNFKSCITKRDDDDKYIFEYNGILGPIAGIFMAYEMLLLCIDIALRSLKLGLLELIAPIIICGYIYSGEVMKKWVKEVVATYILVFVKLAVVSFLILGMTMLPDFLSNNDFSEHALLIKVLIIIGLLQLVKQLPNLINSIFGIEIKSQGGIKGRLGEMAGVGKMASEAWSKLGSKAKGLGKTVALAPLGAAGAGIKKGWNNLAEKNNPAGNFAARVNQAMHGKTGRVLRTLKAGVNSNGKGTAKALTEAWNKDAVTQATREAERLEKSKIRNTRNNMNPAGTGTDFKDKKLNAPFDANSVALKDENGKFILGNDGEKITKSNIKDYLKNLERQEGESDEAFANRKKNINNQLNDQIVKARIEYDKGKLDQLEADVKGVITNVDMNSGISADGKRYFNDFADKIAAKEQIDAAKANQDKMISILETARNNAMDPEKRKALENMIGTVKGNGFYTKSVNDQLAEFDKFKDDIDEGSFNKLKEFNVKFNSQTEGLDAKGAAAIAQVVSTRTKEAENATKVLDAYKDNLTSASTKAEIDEYKNMINVKTKEMVASSADNAYFGGMEGYNGSAGKEAIGTKIKPDDLTSSSSNPTIDVNALSSNPVNSSAPTIDINTSNQSGMEDITDNIVDLMSEVQSTNEEIKKAENKIEEGINNDYNFAWSPEYTHLQDEIVDLNKKLDNLTSNMNDSKDDDSSNDTNNDNE